jgi:hypothetical protein
MLAEIVAELGGDQSNAPEISQEKVRAWMASTDLETMGALYALLSEAGQCARITPALDSFEVAAFLRNYFERCITEDPESEWSDSRYSAGWDLARWLKHWAESTDSDIQDLTEWTRWLGDLYKRGDAAVRLAIETAVLEHVLDDQAVANFFSEWTADAILAEAYRRAVDGPGALPE